MRDRNSEPGDLQRSKRGRMRNILTLIAIIIVAGVIFWMILPPSKKAQEIPLSEAVTMSQRGEIEKIVVNGNELTITAKDNRELKTYKESIATLYDIEGLNLTGVEVDVKGEKGINWGSVLINFLLPLVIFGGLLYFIFRSARGANSQALRFGRSRARLFPSNKPTVTFDDVAGVDEAKV